MIALHEFLYPLLQGYDSVAVNATPSWAAPIRSSTWPWAATCSATSTREPSSTAAADPVGLDGVQKMSKSLGNVVGLEEDLFVDVPKLEKVGDGAIDDYVTLLIDLDLASLPENPREKQKMALAVTASRHGIEAAQKAQSDAATLVVAAVMLELMCPRPRWRR